MSSKASAKIPSLAKGGVTSVCRPAMNSSSKPKPTMNSTARSKLVWNSHKPAWSRSRDASRVK